MVLSRIGAGGGSSGGPGPGPGSGGAGGGGLELRDFTNARRRASTLALFAPVLEDAVGRSFLALLDAILAPTPAEPTAVAAAARLFHALTLHGSAVGDLRVDAWQQHLIARLLDTGTPFAQRAEAVGPDGLGLTLTSQARRELRSLQALYRLDADAVQAAVRAAAAPFPDLTEAVPLPWAGLPAAPAPAGPAADVERQRMAAAIAAATDWGALAPDLAAFFYHYGAGDFGRFRAFRWVRASGGGHLEGVAHPDPVRLTMLVGYERERRPIVRNTEQFVAGYPANNVLIYGDQGTGKSSTVKALFNEYAARGLRLIEVAKEHLEDFPRILALLRGRRERFILFVDDLSFEEQETHYKALKAILEGGIEARPDNVLLYATSNRRHLVRERFGDRTMPGESDDVHVQDTLEEKISLAARFGIRVTYLAPAQERYLTIVRELARTRGLMIGDAALQERALQWAQWQNGRSGRTARQFIDALEGELALEQRDRGTNAAP